MGGFQRICKKDGASHPFCQQTEHGIVRDGRLHKRSKQGARAGRPVPPAFQDKRGRSIVARDHIGVPLFLAHLGFNAVGLL